MKRTLFMGIRELLDDESWAQSDRQDYFSGRTRNRQGLSKRTLRMQSETLSAGPVAARSFLAATFIKFRASTTRCSRTSCSTTICEVFIRKLMAECDCVAFSHILIGEIYRVNLWKAVPSTGAISTPSGHQDIPGQSSADKRSWGCSLRRLPIFLASSLDPRGAPECPARESSSVSATPLARRHQMLR